MSRPVLGALLAMMLLVPSVPAITGPRDSLCTPAERTVFSCHLGRKVASLCTSAPVTADAGYVRYAFGRPGAVELSIPDRDKPSRQSFAVGVVMVPRGGADYVKIRSGSTTYVVYSGEAPGWTQQGVAVQQDGWLVGNLVCSDYALGPDGWQAIYAAKLPNDTEGFELPEPPRRSDHR